MAVACTGNHRSRLFIGEAHFKGVEALLNKHAETHPQLGKSVTATELQTFDRTDNECLSCQMQQADLSDSDSSSTDYCSEVCRRIQSLKDRGVTIILGYDGTKIHKHTLTQNRRYERIQWNCPHDRSNYNNQTLPPIIKKFFKSAAKMQEDGDRIHVTLAQPNGKEIFYQCVVYNIRNAAKENRYMLYAKRSFGSDRYPGYVHEETGREQQAPGAEKQREFVFIKGCVPDGHKKAKIASKTFYNIGGEDIIREYYLRDTDDESSDYDE